MFDLVAGQTTHVPSTPGVPIVVSTTVQAAALGVIFAVSLAATGTIPSVAPIMAFVAEAPVDPPPPPPPPPSTPQPAAAPRVSAAAAPIESPRTIEPEPVVAPAPEEAAAGSLEGVPTNVGGVMPTVVEGPPPPPPPPAPQVVRRIGGDLKVPALLHRVEPIYPDMAVFSHVAGIVLLDAVVDATGHVQKMTVIKGHPLLADAAMNAVRQWEYAPLLLNGNPIPFELTVTLSFHLTTSE
jgi:protein TonB